MNIKMYGTVGCRGCDILRQNIENAIKEIGRDDVYFEIEKSLVRMSEKNISDIPVLEINGEIISSGVVYSSEQIINIINNNEKVDGMKINMVCDDGGCRINDKK